MRRRATDKTDHIVLGVVLMVLMPFWLVGLAWFAKAAVSFPEGMMRWWMWPALLAMALGVGIYMFRTIAMEEDVA